MDSGEYPSWADDLIGNLSAMAIRNLVEYEDNQSAQDDLAEGDLQAVLLNRIGFYVCV